MPVAMRCCCCSMLCDVCCCCSCDCRLLLRYYCDVVLRIRFDLLLLFVIVVDADGYVDVLLHCICVCCSLLMLLLLFRCCYCDLIVDIRVVIDFVVVDMLRDVVIVVRY